MDVRFEEWFENVLLDKILPNSLIVMDNASYHSHRVEDTPCQNWTKGKLIEWLDHEGIVCMAVCILSYSL